MHRTIGVVLVAAAVALLLGALVTRSLTAQDAPTTRPTGDLTVTVRHLDGQVDAYGSELTSLDIVVDSAGHPQYVHCVLVSGQERDTHVWYNFRNVASLRYRFHTITGKAKVSLKQVKPLDVQPKPGLPRKIEPLGVDDYK